MTETFDIYNDEYYILYITKEKLVDRYINFCVKIKDHDFAGAHSFCIMLEDFNSLICDLEEMNRTLNGKVRIEDWDSGSWIEILVNKKRVYTKGQLGSLMEPNMLTFEQILDQTIIKLLLDCFKCFINT